MGAGGGGEMGRVDKESKKEHTYQKIQNIIHKNDKGHYPLIVSELGGLFSFFRLFRIFQISDSDYCITLVPVTGFGLETQAWLKAKT